MKNTNDWDPELYMKFGNERTQPSIDLVNRVHLSSEPKSIIDIGCGPGNSGQALARRWPSAYFLGIDTSQKMIEKAKSDFPNQDWLVADASDFSSEKKFDIVFSNATIQWIPYHEKLIENFFAMLSEHGVLAMQLPKFFDMPIGKIIDTVAQKPKWRDTLRDCLKVFTFHDHSFYYDQLSRHFRSIELWETSYLHVLDSHSSIIEWIKGAGMKPYLDKLHDNKEKLDFEKEVATEVKGHYPIQANGKVLFPFLRLFMIGYK